MRKNIVTFLSRYDISQEMKIAFSIRNYFNLLQLIYDFIYIMIVQSTNFSVHCIVF